MESLIVVNVALPPRYRDWINDTVKFTITLVVIHVLMHLTRQSETSISGLFNLNFIKLVLFLCIGFATYYLVFCKLIRFRFVGEPQEETIFTLRLPNFREWLKSKL